jgi:hypothetical protein
MANVLPDSGSSLNRGFRNDSFVKSSAAVFLLSVCAVPFCSADEFSELDVDRVTFAITFCSFVDGFSDEPSRSTTYTAAPSFVDSGGPLAVNSARRAEKEPEKLTSGLPAMAGHGISAGEAGRPVADHFP